MNSSVGSVSSSASLQPAELSSSEDEEFEQVNLSERVPTPEPARRSNSLADRSIQQLRAVDQGARARCRRCGEGCCLCVSCACWLPCFLAWFSFGNHFLRNQPT